MTHFVASRNLGTVDQARIFAVAVKSASKLMIHAIGIRGLKHPIEVFLDSQCATKRRQRGSPAFVIRAYTDIRRQAGVPSRRTTMRTRKIDRVVRMLKIAAGIGSATWALGASAIEPTASVIEYYNAALNHFFITAYADEAAML